MFFAHSVRLVKSKKKNHSTANERKREQKKTEMNNIHESGRPVRNQTKRLMVNE